MPPDPEDIEGTLRRVAANVDLLTLQNRHLQAANHSLADDLVEARRRLRDAETGVEQLARAVLHIAARCEDTGGIPKDLRDGLRRIVAGLTAKAGAA